MPFLLSEEEHLFSFSSGNYVTASNGLIMTGIVGPKQKWGEEEADDGAEWRLEGNIKRDMVEWMAGLVHRLAAKTAIW